MSPLKTKSPALHLLFALLVFILVSCGGGGGGGGGAVSGSGSASNTGATTVVDDGGEAAFAGGDVILPDSNIVLFLFLIECPQARPPHFNLPCWVSKRDW